MRMRSLAAVLCASLMIFASSCSDDEDPVATEDTTAEDTTADDGTDTTDLLGDAEDVLDGLDSIPGVDDEALDDAQDALDDLDELQDNGCFTFWAIYGQIFAGAATMFGATEEDIAEMEDQLAEMQSEVPEEIADEVEIVAAAYGEFYEDLAGMTLAEMGQLEAPTDDPAVAEADATIQAWYEDNCNTTQ